MTDNKIRPNLRKVLKCFQPCSKGCSTWRTIDDIKKAGLSWSTNGNVRRGVAFGVGEFCWEFKRVGGGKSEITALRLGGHSKTHALNQAIRSDIKQKLQLLTRSNFSPNSLLELTEDDKEIDHRWGRKEAEQYDHINDPSKQTVEDFQLLSSRDNLRKREMCKKCRETNKRFSNGKGYVVGTENWDEKIGCKGCPLAEPELYL